MAGCVSCFVLPLLLFIFHRFIQPIILKFWNPWAKSEDKLKASEEEKTELTGDGDNLKRTNVNGSSELSNDCCARG